MFPTFDDIKNMYAWGPEFMTDKDVSDYVTYGTINADQYKQITGKDYESEATTK